MALTYTAVSPTAFESIQLGAGILLKQFDPANPTIDKSQILMATTGGCAFAANPEYVDYGEDVDNVPANTKQLKRLKSYDPTISGTGLTVDNGTLDALLAGCDYNATSGKYTPRADLKDDDFADLWWVGDTASGFIAIQLLNALNTDGFQLQSTKDAKGQMAFGFHGHYDLTDTTVQPFAVYVRENAA